MKISKFVTFSLTKIIYSAYRYVLLLKFELHADFTKNVSEYFYQFLFRNTEQNLVFLTRIMIFVEFLENCSKIWLFLRFLTKVAIFNQNEDF